MQSTARVEEAGARPIVPQPELRQIRQTKHSVGSQTSNTESLYVKFKQEEAVKESSLHASGSSSSNCVNCESEGRKKTEQKYLISIIRALTTTNRF